MPACRGAGGYRYESKVFRDLEAKSRAEGREEGQARGRALSILRVLDRRGIPITDDQRSRILTCADSATSTSGSTGPSTPRPSRRSWPSRGAGSIDGRSHGAARGIWE